MVKPFYLLFKIQTKKTQATGVDYSGHYVFLLASVKQLLLKVKYVQILKQPWFPEGFCVLGGGGEGLCELLCERRYKF